MKYKICYSRDASDLKGEVDRVVFPENIEEIPDIIKKSNNIVPRGFGISQTGGCIPDNSVVIDMRKINKIQFDKNENKVIVGAGLSIKELNEKLKPLGYEFPVYSSDKSMRSVGGAIALNCFGDRSMKYGQVINWIEEIEMVNGRGEIIKIGKVDLADICGTEGITGIIVRAKIKISPIIKRSISVFQSDDYEEVLAIAKRLKLDDEIVMIKFFPKFISRLLGFPEKYHLIIEFNSERGKIRDNYKKLMKKNNKDLQVLYSEEYCESFAVQMYYEKISKFVEFLEENQIPYFGNLGVEIVHVFFKKNEKEKIKKTLEFLEKFKFSFIGGFGLKRKDWINESEQKILERIKKRYDPFNKINRGKVIGLKKKDSKEIKSSLEKDSIEMPVEYPKKNEEDYDSIKDIMTNNLKGYKK